MQLYKEFKGDSRMTLTSGTQSDTLEGEGSDLSLRVEGGIGSPGKAGPMLTGWVEGGDVRSAGIRAGLRF